MIDRTAEPPSAKVARPAPHPICPHRTCCQWQDTHTGAETCLTALHKVAAPSRRRRQPLPSAQIFWAHISAQAQNPLGHGLPPKLACCARAADPAGCLAAIVGSCSESWCLSCSAEPGVLNRWPAACACTRCPIMFAGCPAAYSEAIAVGTRGPRLHPRRHWCCQWWCTDDCVADSCQCQRT